MSIFTDKRVRVGKEEYIYTLRMHNKINSLANTFYVMQGSIDRKDFEYCESSHPTERLMYSMALQAYIATGKVKPIK